MVYKLKKSKAIFFHTVKLFRKKKKKLPENLRQEISNTLSSMQHHLMKKDVDESGSLAKKCELLARLNLKKSFFDHIVEFVFGAIFALIAATIIRQMWFELYEIPSGSMRPSLMEKDRLVVSKAQFGINIPLSLNHLVFDPSEVKRSGMIIFSAKGLDFPDTKTRYFYLFPGYKVLVKRLIGKPGDTLYFYGGRIYGIDKNGKDISHELAPSSLSHINHVPFFSFEGDLKIKNAAPHSNILSPVVIHQMGLPVAKMTVTPFKQVQGEILYSSEPDNKVEHYDALFGFKNFAHVRMLVEEGKYMLEMKHSPSLKNALLKQNLRGYLVPTLATSLSYIPLDEALLKKIHTSLFTDRFIVKSGYLKRESQPYPPISEGVPNRYPKLAGIPDGTYEFVGGQPYEILWGGIAKKLPSTHPIAAFSAEKTLLFFNLGIEFDTAFEPSSGYNLFPSRYAFFRNNALYLMDKEVLSSDHPTLVKYMNNEMQREKNSNGGYHPFIDLGPPLLPGGALDVNLIEKAGIKVPEGHYFVLGDNYPVSADSRKWGFVPEGNLKGVPEFIFWPPSPRFGLPNQPLYPLLTMPRLIVWLLAGIVFIIWRFIERKHHHLPISAEQLK